MYSDGIRYLVPLALHLVTVPVPVPVPDTGIPCDEQCYCPWMFNNCLIRAQTRFDEMEVARTF